MIQYIIQFGVANLWQTGVELVHVRCDRRQLVGAEGHLHGKALHLYLYPLFSLQIRHELVIISFTAMCCH